MRVAVVTLFPTMIDEFIRHGVLSRSVASGLLEVTTYNPRDYTVDAHRTVDDSCLLYTSPSPRDATLSRMPSSA